MHSRGSKEKGTTDLRRDPPSSRTSPPSAEIEVLVEVARAGRSTVRSERVVAGTLVKELLRRVGQAPEGSAVLVDGRSVPLDTPLSEPVRLVIVPTFSGG